MMFGQTLLRSAKRNNVRGKRAPDRRALVQSPKGDITHSNIYIMCAELYTV
jgi:hypothetical protein